MRFLLLCEHVKPTPSQTWSSSMKPEDSQVFLFTHTLLYLIYTKCIGEENDLKLKKKTSKTDRITWTYFSINIRQYLHKILKFNSIGILYFL